MDLQRERVWPYPVDVTLRSFVFCLMFLRPVPLSFMDSPRASNADPFSCLLAFRVSRLFSFMAALCRMNGGMGQGFGASRQCATVLHGCNVSTSSCPHALQGRSIPATNEGVGIFFACIPLHWQRVAATPGRQALTRSASMSTMAGNWRVSKRAASARWRSSTGSTRYRRSGLAASHEWPHEMPPSPGNGRTYSVVTRRSTARADRLPSRAPRRAGSLRLHRRDNARDAGRCGTTPRRLSTGRGCRAAFAFSSRET